MSTPYSLYLVTLTGGHEFEITVQEGKGMFERPVQKNGLRTYLNGYEANRWAEFLNVMIMMAVYKRVYK
jgi:hypothetical protein